MSAAGVTYWGTMSISRECRTCVLTSLASEYIADFRGPVEEGPAAPSAGAHAEVLHNKRDGVYGREAADDPDDQLQGRAAVVLRRARLQRRVGGIWQETQQEAQRAHVVLAEQGGHADEDGHVGRTRIYEEVKHGREMDGLLNHDSYDADSRAQAFCSRRRIRPPVRYTILFCVEGEHRDPD